MMYNPVSTADVATISDYFRTMVLSAGAVARPLRETDAMTLVLASALEAIAGPGGNREPGRPLRYARSSARTTTFKLTKIKTNNA